MSDTPAEATPLSDQEKIRVKRIAKLQQQSQQPSPATPESGPSTPRQRPVQVPAPSPPTPAPKPQPKLITVLPAGTSARFAEPFPVWEDAVISRVLQVTLSREQAEGSNWSLAYIKELEVDLLAENNGPPRIPTVSELANLTKILLARLSLSPATMTDDPEILTTIAALPSNQTLFEYLGGCWKREKAERYSVIQKKGADPKEVAQRLEVLNTLKRLIVSYLGLILDDPTMFPQDHVTKKPLGALELRPLLLPSSSPGNTSSLTSSDLPGILQDLSAAPDSSISSLVGLLIADSAREILVNKLDIGGGGNGGISWREHLSAVHSLTENKAVAAALVDCDTWDVTTQPGGANAAGIEIFTLLGPFLRLSTFPEAFPNIASSYFPSPSDMSHGDIDSATKNLRGTLANVQSSLFRIMDNVVRSGPKPREGVLSLLGHVAQANVKRAAMQVDSRVVSSNGFIVNLHNVLLSFAAPFMDSTFSKIDKIDPLYYKYSNRIGIAEVTKMQATQVESDAFYAKAEGEIFPTPNFISEVFFLCCSYLHIGPMRVIKEHHSMGKQISYLKKDIVEMEADITWRGTPNEATVQANIERYKKEMELRKSKLHAFEVQILDPEYLARCLGFINLVMAWLVRLVDPKKMHPKIAISLPLPEETPEAFRMLPEYLIEDITEFLTFTSKYAPQVLAATSQEELVSFMLVFLSTPYMKNPYLKGQFIMYYLTRPDGRNPRGSLGDVINFHPLALKNLMPCLVHAYVQIEITGSHTQFYDKFNTRYYITQLFKLVWSNPSHREALKAESLHLDRYVRFVNLLMNDTTYLLEEGIRLLHLISDIQKKMDDKEEWEARPITERQEQEKLLREYEGSARSDIELGHESLRLLKLFSAETEEPFLTPEIVDRLAAMLDMNLDMLAGPTCQNLRVREPEKYKFVPKELLSDVLQIFLHLGPRIEFQQAVAKDGRSYSRDLFARADRIARKNSLKTDEELSKLQAMVEKVEELKAAEEEDDAMGEVPDDFLDPLTYDIMRDPVILPSSKTIVDRSTIKQHYLSDATDPFNRVPLKWEDLVEATELKAQIAAFLAERKQNRKGSSAEQGDEDVMAVDV
ncbi:ubiquitin conjugation factor E4 B, partial [Phenoliferia sp. Uapishka_3]